MCLCVYHFYPQGMTYCFRGAYCSVAINYYVIYLVIIEFPCDLERGMHVLVGAGVIDVTLSPVYSILVSLFFITTSGMAKYIIHIITERSVFLTSQFLRV